MASHDQGKAALAVFETYELLEAILLNLPAASLPSLRRTCRQWHSLIDRSENIRRSKTFLSACGPAVEPIPGGNKGAMPRYVGGEMQLTPMLHLRESMWMVQVQTRNRKWKDPVLACIVKTKRGMIGTLKINITDHAVHHGSWKDVLITNPPIKSVRMEIRDKNWPSNLTAYNRIVYNENGLTLGDVFQAHQDLIDELIHLIGNGLEVKDIRATFVLRRSKEFDGVQHAVRSFEDMKERYVFFGAN